MGLFRSLTGAIKDIASDLGSAVNTLVIDPTKDIIEGGLDLTENTINTGLNTAGSLLQGDLSGAYGDLRGGVKNVGNILDETYMDIRDPAVAAAVLAGNYFLPGSSMLTSRLANEGAQNILGSSGGKTLNFASGAAGGFNGNMSNYGFGSANPNAVGSVYGPDNIDIGGGWSPSGITGSGFTTGSSLADRFLANKAISSLTGNSSAGTGNMATTNNADLNSLLSGLFGTAGNLMQGSTNVEARQKQADALKAAGQQASVAAQFRPVGTTTRFGSSNFQVDPATGQLISAGYSASPMSQGYQDQLAGMTSQGLMQGQQLQGLANQYLGESPEAVRQRYIDQQNALVAGSNEQALAGIRNNLFQTGRQGLSTGATTAGGMAATNPELAAYYNALAKQQAGFAAGADTAAQNQITFGQGLANTAYTPFTAGFGAQGAVEKAAQQPLDISTELAKQFQQANATGAKYNLAAQDAATQALFENNQYNPYASLISGLGDSTKATSAIGGLLNSSGLGSSLANIFSSSGGSIPSWATSSDVFPTSTFSSSGNDFAQMGIEQGWW